MLASDPSLQVARSDLRREWARMRAEPRPLERPLLVLSGWRARSWLPRTLCGKFQSLLGDDRISAFAYPTVGTFREVRDRLLAFVDEQWPSDDPARTTGIDVVGVSMGGLVARYAASGLDGCERTLNVQRLFTFATPHRGARLADVIALDPAARDMRAGSAFLSKLDGALTDADYELTCYARLNDAWVGARRTAPQGHAPLWRQPSRVVPSHLTVSRDPWFITDVARRLRGEEPLATRGGPPPRD